MAQIGIAGAGIIGCATALHLLARGHQVTMFERDLDAVPASSGNAGILAVPEIDPLARPDMIAKVPGWLLDPLGPLALRWQDVPALATWLFRFLNAAKPGQVARSRNALLKLMRDAADAHRQLADLAGIATPMDATGALTIFSSASALDKAYTHEAETGRLLGFDVEKFDAGATRRREPALEGAFAGAVFSGGYQTFRNGPALLAGLRAEIRARARLVSARVDAIQSAADGIGFFLPSGERLIFDKGVIAAGVWSRDLVRKLGLKVHLETERGYNTTFTDPAVRLAVPVFFAEHGFVATPFENALRVGGAVELARPEAPPNFARAAAMRTRMRRYVPSLPETGGIEWMGCRPSTPDSVPVIGLNPKDPRIALAFGHGHLGLTLSAVTGRRVADLLDGSDVAGMEPFGIERFQ